MVCVAAAGCAGGGHYVAYRATAQRDGTVAWKLVDDAKMADVRGSLAARKDVRKGVRSLGEERRRAALDAQRMETHRTEAVARRRKAGGGMRQRVAEATEQVL